MEEEFNSGHQKGAVNLPLFRRMQGNSPRKWAKRFYSWLTGEKASVRNPDFVNEALERFPRDQTIIIACALGGSLELDVTAAQARDARRYTTSLVAAAELYDA